MISQERMTGSWNSLAGAIREKFGQVTQDELSRVKGNVEQVIGLIQRKTGENREQIEAFLDECMSNTGATISRVTDKASEYAEAATETVREGYNRVAHEAQRGYDYTVSTMKRRPVESLAIALGVGALAGLIVGLSLAARRH